MGGLRSSAHDEAPWRKLVDLGLLKAWMDGRNLGSGPIADVEPLSGGTQNVLLRFKREELCFILRRPPESPYLDGDETIRREARILHALAATQTPHPRLIAACGDGDVLGSAFYLMEPVDGFCPPQGLPKLHQTSSVLRHAMGLSVVKGLATLHSADFLSLGLNGFGKPDGFLERQAPRWLKQLDSYFSYEGWDGRADLRGVDEVGEWLGQNLPKDYRPGIVHGDFHLGNVLISQEGPDLRAIVDWELATIGDPRVDLGCLLATWADPQGHHPGCISVTPWDGFATEAELVECYATTADRDVSGYNWFVVLACFKLAILQEGTYARSAVGKADPKTAEWLHSTSIKLIERALARI